VRRCAIALYTLLLSVTLYCYRDREEVMHQLLEQIKSQNEQLLKYINKEGLYYFYKCSITFMIIIYAILYFVHTILQE